MLIDEIKERIKKAMLAKNEVEKGILRVVLGEAQQKNFTKDEDLHKIIKKVVEGNSETIRALPESDSRKSVLVQENEILQKMLPVLWDRMSIEAFFLNSNNSEFEQIRDAKSGGQAMGIAMKALKGKPVAGEDVSAVVNKIRES